MEQNTSVEKAPASAESETLDQSDDQKTGDVAAAAEKSPQSRRDRRAERRIAKLTARNAELAEEITKRDQRFAELEQKIDKLAQPKLERPQRENFETDEDYEDALVDYRLELRKPTEQKPESKTEPGPDPDLQSRFVAFVESGMDVDETFDKTVSAATFPLTDHSLGEIIEMGEDGVELFNYLNDNPKDAMRICRLSPRDQTSELEKLADALDEKSSAPDPINPVDGNDKPPVDEAKMPTEQRILRRMKARAGR